MSNRVQQTDAAVLAGSLRMAMMRLVRRIKRETGGAEPASSISALAAVARLGEPAVGELAEAEGISRPSASQQVDLLEARGLVARVGSTSDRRMVHIRITPVGERVLSRSRRERTAWFARRLRRLPEADLAILAAATPILERLLEEDA